jgi:hypothetical protein
MNVTVFVGPSIGNCVVDRYYYYKTLLVGCAMIAPYARRQAFVPMSLGDATSEL